jgi:hypothetical protein
LYDAAAVDRDYQVQLLEHEYHAGGPFAPMCEWLAVHAFELGSFYLIASIVAAWRLNPGI